MRVFIMFSASLQRGLIHFLDLGRDQVMIVGVVHQQQFVDGFVDGRAFFVRQLEVSVVLAGFFDGQQDRVGFHARFAHLRAVEILLGLFERLLNHRFHLLVGQAVRRLHLDRCAPCRCAGRAP